MNTPAAFIDSASTGIPALLWLYITHPLAPVRDSPLVYLDSTLPKFVEIGRGDHPVLRGGRVEPGLAPAHVVAHDPVCVCVQCAASCVKVRRREVSKSP